MALSNKGDRIICTKTNDRPRIVPLWVTMKGRGKNGTGETNTSRQYGKDKQQKGPSGNPFQSSTLVNNALRGWGLRAWSTLVENSSQTYGNAEVLDPEFSTITRKRLFLRSEVLRAVKKSTLVFWVVTPRRLAGRYQRFEDGDTMLLWNVGIYQLARRMLQTGSSTSVPKKCGKIGSGLLYRTILTFSWCDWGKPQVRRDNRFSSRDTKQEC
jgi:hypothetical protein